jgi:NDP-sugar pyrophosphorylase family protein
MLGVPAGDRAPEFGSSRFAGFSLISGRYIAGLRPEPTDLVREVWRPVEAAGNLRVIDYAGSYLDCGTPGDYLAANLHAASHTGVGGSLVDADAHVTGLVTDSVVGPGATVSGRVERAVVWPDGVVEAHEELVDAIRYAGSATVRVRGPQHQVARPKRPTASA